MADWLADVRKYVADADEAVVDKIVKYLGIALRNRDSSLVSFSDKKETDLVRENYLKKKLGLTDSDAELDASIAAVGERMKEDRTKNRVTVYYLLAEHYDSLGLFGGVAGAADAAAAGLAAASASDGTEVGNGIAADPEAAGSTTRQAAYSGGGTGDVGSVGFPGWLKWLLLLLALALLIFLLLRYCSPQAAAPAADGTEATSTTESADGMKAADGEPAKADDTATAAPAAIPTGAGVVASDVAGKPKLTVYFDTGKSVVSNDLTAAAANVKAYLEKNAGAKLAVSGYNDPSGNAAINAKISKERAQGVKAALEKLGIPATSIELVKPSDTTDTSTDATAARRVEVTIQ